MYYVTLHFTKYRDNKKNFKSKYNYYYVVVVVLKTYIKYFKHSRHFAENRVGTFPKSWLKRLLLFWKLYKF